MTSLDELMARIQREDADRKQRAQDRFNQILTAAFAEIPALNFIRIQGYTPGFNDGDPCVHTQGVMVDIYDPDYLMESVVDYARDDAIVALLTSEKKLDYQERTWNRETGQYEDNPLPEDAHAAAIVKVGRLLRDIEDDIYLLFNTDWQLDIVRDNTAEGGFRVSREDYECGY